MLTEFAIGIDDTDSKLGGCTTYTGALLFHELSQRQFGLVDFPWLVRLNPNIPWKTRGNGALALHLLIEEERIEQAKKIALRTVRNTSDPSVPSTDPATVFLRGPKPALLKTFSKKALYNVITIAEGKLVAEAIGAEVHLLGKARGLIGALAAIGADLSDHTFEIIAYRSKRRLGTLRQIDWASVKEMDSRYQNRTFSNIDRETGRILISPHGPDPVLFGIRGEDPASLLGAMSCVRVKEPIERTMIFKTNSGTDAHLCCQRTIQDLRLHESVIVSGIVQTSSRVLRGGHLIFTIRDGTGSLDCAAFEPVGSLRKIVKQLLPGDHLKVYGGISRGPSRQLTLNLEKLEILKLEQKTLLSNPACPNCGSSCESMGVGQGFRCRGCNLRLPTASRITTIERRELSPGTYLPPTRAHRHLTMPASRLDAERRTSSLNDPAPLLGMEENRVRSISLR
jgi:tRNA(Ile2)-agmatinylcytidine synthase